MTFQLRVETYGSAGYVTGKMINFATSLLLFLLATLSAQVWSEDWAYRIHEGENLTIVAERFLKSEFTPEQLQIYNGITNDREIKIGTEIRVPIDWLKEVLAGVKVNYVVGSASLLRRGKSEPTVLLKDAMLNAGDKIITAADSLVSLKFADDSTLLIDEESEVVFDALSSFHGMGMLDTRIRLQRGRVENRIKPVRKPEYRYEIHTPAAVTVVRGTDFRVASGAEDELTRSEVTQGAVNITAGGETVAVEQGEGTLIEKGGPPAPPRKLLQKPDLNAVILHTTPDDMTLEWPGLSGAAAYRYQLSDSQQRVLTGGTAAVNRLQLPMMPAGDYRITIRGIDELGLEGFNAYHDFSLQPAAPASEPERAAAIEAPTLLQPQFSQYGIHIQWTPVDGAWAYSVMLARDVEMRDVLLTGLAEDHGFVLRPLAPGRYFVAVEALSAVNDDRSRSNIYHIEIPAWR
ncbi:MAG: FecR domain-containing protein [Candidatus Thiodiazotropha sp.]